MISERPIQPASGGFERIAHRRPLLGRRLVGEQLHLALRVVLPLALDRDHQHQVVAFADRGDAFEAEAGLAGQKLRREGDLLLDRALGVDVQHARAASSLSVRPSEASQKPPSPSAAMPSRSSFWAGLPSRVTMRLAGDQRRRPGGVDGEDRGACR